MEDLVIRNGTIVDGTGTARFTGDIAMRDGKLTQVGGKAGAAKRELDASGALVTPGWVDIHTHYDGQVTWDPYLSPSSWHGVTSVVMGNCGVGFAPVKPDKRAWVIDLMEGVEDIPGAALSAGIQWEWETFPQYMAALRAKKLAINVGAQIPHGPLRTYVMGERGADNDEATTADIAQMSQLVEEALQVGALGFSTSRTLIHKSSSGNLVPGTFATRPELFGIGHALKRAGKGVFQMTSNHIGMPQEVLWMADLARETGRPVAFNVQQIDQAPTLWQGLLKAVTDAQAQGVPLVGAVAGRPAGLLFSWQSSVHPFIAYPSFHTIAALPLEEKLAKLRDPAFKAALLAEAPKPLGEFGEFITKSFHKMFALGQGSAMDYEPTANQSAAAIATAQGQDPRALVYDWMMQDGGKAIIYFPIFNYSNHDFEHLRQLMESPHTLLSLGDGGAHCGVICDASLPTFMLTHWVRDRSRGPRMPLEFMVKRQTRDTARTYGITNRGTLEVGMQADINIIDFEKLAMAAPEMVHDLPANGRRLVQRATGYAATLVGSEPIYLAGEATGAMPGVVL
jgi:N-acyl-D-amino-acid deacylase